MLIKWRRFFHQMAAEQGQAGLAAVDVKLEVAALQVGQSFPASL
jgi:proline dehydrogenase